MSDAERIMAKAEKDIEDMPVTSEGQNFGDGSESYLIAAVGLIVAAHSDQCRDGRYFHDGDDYAVRGIVSRQFRCFDSPVQCDGGLDYDCGVSIEGRPWRRLHRHSISCGVSCIGLSAG